MKQTFIIVGIIASFIIVMVLILNNSPDLFSDKYDYVDELVVTKQQFKDLEFSIVTSEPDFWDKVADLKKEQTSVDPDVTSVNITDKNEITPVTDTDEDKIQNSGKEIKKNTPVTSVPH